MERNLSEEASPWTAATRALRRREFLTYFSGIGLGTTLLPGALLAIAQDEPRVTTSMIEQAEKLAGLSFTDAQRKQMERGVNERANDFTRIRERPLTNGVPPCTQFDPLPLGLSRPAPGTSSAPKMPQLPELELPADLEELAFLPLWQLSELVHTRAVTSTELTEMYLARLERFDPKLLCVITLTRELALAQAKQADAEIAAGHWRGPLHGIPWGAKDLLHTKGIRTTYGAEPYRDQVPTEDAAVVERLREAGAVLVAKLSLGALAMGDVWFGGMTRNPWKPDQGSSGSSAGSASATAAGLLGFAIGTETLGSIVSPATRCGVTGLRPTFGTVSRHGAMALSWTMDKLGPLCRSALDCALVFAAIRGKDERDRSTVDVAFEFDATRPWKGLKVGYLKDGFRNVGDAPERATLETLRTLGLDPVAVSLPGDAAGDLGFMLEAEAACAFDELTRNGGVDQLKEQGPGSWPNLFRSARLIPAVEYLRASRLRTLLLQETAVAFGDFDVIVAPPYAGNVLSLTNLTGHPALCLPNGFRKDGTPTSITFIGRLYGEAALLLLGHAFQQATDFHSRVPEGFAK